MIYNVYENFIVPRICENDTQIYGGKKKPACRLLGHVSADDFQPLKGDPTGILYKAKSDYLKSANVYFKGESPDAVTSAPPGYKLTYVGCYKREKIRNRRDAECSLFFMILETRSNPKLPPIMAVKGSSHSEDWRNNMLAGAPILREFTALFSTELFKQLKVGIVGAEGESMPADIRGFSHALSGFFTRLTAKSHRMIFTGHSLGGALAQELARSIFIATRSDLRDRSSGPTVNVITWNGLSYTSMIGRLRTKVREKLDPIHSAGWKEEDALQLENFQRVFDGRYLSAVNFHTADDLLTSVVNLSIVGKFLRTDQHNGLIHAGADVLLPTQRHIQVETLKGQRFAHSTAVTLKDALYSAGMIYKDNKYQLLSVAEQREQLIPRAASEARLAEYKGSGAYFVQNGLNSDGFNKDGSQNFDRLQVFGEIRKHKKRADKLSDMHEDLEKNVKYFGRFLGDELGHLTKSFYQ